MELNERASRIAAWIERLPPGEVAPRVGIMAHRSLDAYAGVLASCWAGATYVPVNPHWPEARITGLLEAARLDALILDDVGVGALTDAVSRFAPPRRLTPSSTLTERSPGPVRLDAPSLAYILFTSGTTGVPKGVQITVGNVTQFCDVLKEWYAFTPNDRFSQHSELTFDVSVFDLFLSWGSGQPFTSCLPTSTWRQGVGSATTESPSGSRYRR